MKEIIVFFVIIWVIAYYILKELEAQGIEDGDTVRMYGFEFDYYK